MTENRVWDNVEKEIAEILDELDRNATIRGDAAWTCVIKKKLRDLGERLGYVVYASPSLSEDNAEWLFDLCWCEQDGDRVLDLPLAMESEWDRSVQEIRDDFQKLLISRAAHRVMVFWQSTEEGWRTCCEQLVDQIRLYKGTQKGDRYMFCGWAGITEQKELLQLEQFVVP